MAGLFLHQSRRKEPEACGRVGCNLLEPGNKFSDLESRRISGASEGETPLRPDLRISRSPGRRRLKLQHFFQAFAADEPGRPSRADNARQRLGPSTPEQRVLLQVHLLPQPQRRIPLECQGLAISEAVVCGTARSPASPSCQCAHAKHARTEWPLRVEIGRRGHAGKHRPTHVPPRPLREPTIGSDFARTGERSAPCRLFAPAGALRSAA